jgi:hypothetical protein
MAAGGPEVGLGADNTHSVTPGLDPGGHDAAKQAEPYVRDALRFVMDCRVTPGNDVARVLANTQQVFRLPVCPAMTLKRECPKTITK